MMVRTFEREKKGRKTMYVRYLVDFMPDKSSALIACLARGLL